MPNMADEHTLHSLHDIQGLLQEIFSFETLPYLDTLRWIPTSDPGATEKLQIGTCDGKKVFAYFNVRRSSTSQLSILREHSRQQLIEVAKKDMRNVEYLEPFSYWMATAENSEKIAQYLKACFLLRGHAGGKSVVIDKYHFSRVVEVIESKREGGEQQASTLASAAGKVNTLRGMIGVDEVDYDMTSRFSFGLTPRQNISSSPFGATPSDSEISHAFDKLTEEGRAVMVADMEPPEITVVDEYITVINNMAASQARMTMHRGLVAQHEAQIRKLQEATEIATASADKCIQNIMKDPGISNQAISSLTSIVDLSARLEAQSESASRFQAVEAEIAKARTTCADRTTELRSKIAELEKEAEMEGERVTAAEKEVETARKRKREMKEVGGTDLAFLAGREIERAAKKPRTE